MGSPSAVHASHGANAQPAKRAPLLIFWNHFKQLMKSEAGHVALPELDIALRIFPKLRGSPFASLIKRHQKLKPVHSNITKAATSLPELGQFISPSRISPEKLSQASKAPDLETLDSRLAKFMLSPKRGEGTEAQPEENHFFDYKTGVGNALDMVCSLYNELVYSLWARDWDAAAEHMGKLSHYAADLMLPEHTRCDRRNGKFIMYNKLRHLLREISMATRELSCRPEIGYIRGGETGIRWELMKEMKKSRKLLSKPFLTKSDEEKIYSRSVSIVSKIAYTAFVDAGLIQHHGIISDAANFLRSRLPLADDIFRKVYTPEPVRAMRTS